MPTMVTGVSTTTKDDDPKPVNAARSAALGTTPPCQFPVSDQWLVAPAPVHVGTTAPAGSTAAKASRKVAVRVRNITKA